jgi:two-component system response regulator
MSPTAGILLVEDNPNDLELTLHSLRKHRLANPICVVRDGVAALDYVSGTGSNVQPSPQDRPKIIFLNLKLPKLDGIEVLRRLKSDKQTQDIPVVVLLSSRDEAEIVRRYDLGVTTYVVKPLQFENLVRAVSEAGLYWRILETASV